MYSLPSLREVYSTTLDPIIDSFRPMIGLTFTFTNRGHGLYMCSPTEIQKITLSADVKYELELKIKYDCFICLFIQRTT